MVSQGMRDSFWLWGMQVGLKGAYDYVKAFSEIDMTEDLGRIEAPTLDHSRRRRSHCDDDKIVPIKASARRSVQLVRNGTLKEYRGEPHGVAQISPRKDESTPTCSSSSKPEAAIGERDWRRGGVAYAIAAERDLLHHMDSGPG